MPSLTLQKLQLKLFFPSLAEKDGPRCREEVRCPPFGQRSSWRPNNGFLGTLDHLTHRRLLQKIFFQEAHAAEDESMTVHLRLNNRHES